MEDDVDKLIYESNLEMFLVDIWIVLTGLLNIATNVLILYCLIKAKLFRPIYILIFHIAGLELVQQLFCPTVFKLFANIDDIFRDFTSHKVFTCIYGTTLYFIAFLMFLLMLRIHLKCLEKTYLFVIAVYWFLAFVSFSLGFISFQTYAHRFYFIPPYLMVLVVLLIYVHIHQIRMTLNHDQYSGVDYQVSVLIVLTFVSSRLIGVLFFLLGEVTYGLVALNSDYLILGALQLVSIANLFIIARFEEDVKNHARFLFRSRRRTTVNEFRSLQEDHTLPE